MFFGLFVAVLNNTVLGVFFFFFFFIYIYIYMFLKQIHVKVPLLFGGLLNGCCFRCLFVYTVGLGTFPLLFFLGGVKGILRPPV